MGLKFETVDPRRIEGLQVYAVSTPDLITEPILISPEARAKHFMEFGNPLGFFRRFGGLEELTSLQQSVSPDLRVAVAGELEESILRLGQPVVPFVLVNWYLALKDGEVPAPVLDRINRSWIAKEQQTIPLASPEEIFLNRQLLRFGDAFTPDTEKFTASNLSQLLAITKERDEEVGIFHHEALNRYFYVVGNRREVPSREALPLMWAQAFDLTLHTHPINGELSAKHEGFLNSRKKPVRHFIGKISGDEFAFQEFGRLGEEVGKRLNISGMTKVLNFEA